MRFLNFFGLALATISSVNAQTFTSCNPLKKSCPADPALGTSHSWTFNQTLDDHIWDASNGHVDFTAEGAQLSIKEKLQSPTLQSKFYIFFGVVESHIKMAKGGGIVSSVVLQSDDLDEIDWEWVGYNTTGVQSNYYGKGNASSYGRGGYHYVPNADTEFHNYTTYWTKDKIEWWIDQELVRTLNYEDALEGRNFPQTPSNVRYGIWPAGDSGNAKGTIDWAGGVVDYDAGPYTMVVEKVRVQDFASGKEYEYKDNSGAWESINVVTYVFPACIFPNQRVATMLTITRGNSTTVTELNKPPPKSMSEKWHDMPTGAKAGVGIGAGAGGCVLLALLVLFFVRQRRKGRLEHALDDTKYNEDRTEMSNFQSDWKQSEFGHKGYRAMD